MSEIKESETKAPAETATPAPSAAPVEAEKQISLALEQPPSETLKPDAIASLAANASATAPSASQSADTPAIASIKPEAGAAAKETRTSSRANRFALLAASVALAAAIGSLAGALAVSVIARPGPAPSQSPLAALDLTELQDSIATVRNELAALKVSVDSGARASSAQFAKAAERFERVERAQAASAAQLAKSIEAIDRRAEAARDVTGSVRPQSQPAAAPSSPAESLRGPVLEGWIVRNVNRNVAFIQGRRFGVIEVETGDIVPGVGRIHAIRKHTDGRWIVVTSKGLIVSAR
jgi:hypothetical protein